MTKSARKGERMRSGAALVEQLQNLGVRHVFGLIGSSAMEVYDALYDAADIEYIGAKDERAAVGMADGYARASGGLGVVLAGQSGPGVTNLVSGLAAAKAARSPILSIGGAVSTQHWQLDSFQEVDQESLLRPVTKQVLSVLRGERVADVVARAGRLALAAPMGPVHVNIPRDLLAEEVPAPARSAVRPVSASVLDVVGVQDILSRLRAARRPVIVAGGGVKWSNSGEAVARLATRLSVPMATSAGHRDCVPNDHELFLGQMGARGSALANEVILESDLVIGIGTRFGFNSTFFDPTVFAPGATVIQTDSDPASVGRYLPDAVAVLAESAALVAALLEGTEDMSASDPDWARTVSERVARRREERLVPPPEKTLGPDTFFQTMRESLPRQAMVTLDAGTWCLKASEELDFFDPPSLFTPLDFASLGFGFPAAIGAQIARPDRRAVATIGDGGALFALSELATLVEYDVPVVLVIMDNQAWGAEKAYQKDFYDSRFIGTDLPRIDFVAVAKGFGVSAVRVDDRDSLKAALAEAFAAARPFVISAEVDRTILHSFRKDIFSAKS